MKELISMLIREYDISEKEAQRLFNNYCDAILYNKYLRTNEEYLALTALSKSKQLKLIEFFSSRGFKKEVAKKIIVSAPMLLYCEDFEEQLDIVYKDSSIEGIIIKDEEGVNHPYRIKNNLRCITENPFMLNEMVMDSDSDYKKVYYTRSKR